MNRRLRPFLAALVVVLAACGGALEASKRPERPRLPGVGFGARGSSMNESSNVASSTRGDLKTFAFASGDAKALAAEVTAVAAPAGASSVSYDAVELLDEAQRLERLAESATRRLKGADPTNRALVGARREGLTVFSLTADYARLLIDFGNADKNDDLALLNSAANDALALEGTGDQLGASYSALIAQLHGWARTHPQAAARARAQYGD